MRYLLLFGAEALLFFVCTINFRACAKGHMKMTIGTDGLIAGINFTLIKWIADANTPVAQIVYIAGACVGSYIGMFYTRHWSEQ